MNGIRFIIVTFAASIAISPLVRQVQAQGGPLDPSMTGDPTTGNIPPVNGSGEPQPFMRTVFECEPRIPIHNVPFVIDTSGSYYLTRHMTNITGDGISVFADDVTIDLNGFALRGQVGTGVGILAPLPQSNITIKNGTIRNWILDGIEAASTESGRYENLTLMNCGERGVHCGDSSSLQGLWCENNGQGGILAGNECRIRDVSVKSGLGIVAGSGSVISDCTVRGSTGNGIDFGARSRISSCTVEQCAGDGLFTSGDGSYVQGNFLCRNNIGLEVQGTNTVITQNVAIENTAGNYLIASNNYQALLLDPGVVPGTGFSTDQPLANVDIP